MVKWAEGRVGQSLCHYGPFEDYGIQCIRARGGSLVDRDRQVAGLGCEVKEDGGFVELDRQILEHPTLFSPLEEYTQQSQLWHQSLDANPVDASTSSERQRNLHKMDIGSCRQSGWWFAATMVDDLEALVSWIVVWMNESSSSVYHCVLLRSQRQTILR